MLPPREKRWQELLGLNISHCTFGPGTISKVEGEYIYVDLPERQGKKTLTEFGLESFLRGFFSNLQINNSLHEKIIAAAAASQRIAISTGNPRGKSSQEASEKEETR